MAFFRKDICPYCSKKYNKFIYGNCPNCDGIDFDNVVRVEVVNIEERYHDEIEEERDIVASYNIDGKEYVHYQTKPVINTVYDGMFYTFLINFNNGTNEYREYEKGTSFSKKLITLIKEKLSLEINVYKKIVNEFWVEMLESPLNCLDDTSVFVRDKMKYLQKCDYSQYVSYLKKMFICVLSNEVEGDIFESGYGDQIQCIQPVKDKYDGFILLQKKNKIKVEEVEQYLELKRKYNFRKLNVIFTSFLDKKAMSYIGHDEIVLWDFNCLHQFLLRGYSKVVLEKLEERYNENSNITRY